MRFRSYCKEKIENKKLKNKKYHKVRDHCHYSREYRGVAHSISNQENLYMIHHDSDLFYGIYNTINKHTTTFHRFENLLISIFE